uniref:Replication protein A C-terminal domain-containing protein n=1 Tax=Timema poppense TaxID=170557 RepID=A0A7R9D3C3_TIMPO|nr:unnamed protein product [Timema poppensis]
MMCHHGGHWLKECTCRFPGNMTILCTLGQHLKSLLSALSDSGLGAPRYRVLSGLHFRIPEAYCKNSISDCGVTHEDIMQQLPIKLTMTELNALALDLSGTQPVTIGSATGDRKETVTFLSNEGHIYSTIDDEHFKSTDS